MAARAITNREATELINITPQWIEMVLLGSSSSAQQPHWETQLSRVGNRQSELVREQFVGN